MTQDRSEATRRGLAKARIHGRKLGRKPKVSDAEIRKVLHLGTKEASDRVELSKSQYITRRKAIEERKSTMPKNEMNKEIETVCIGQKWREKDSRFQNLPAREVVGFDPSGRVLLMRPDGRVSKCHLKRFNGKNGGYELC